MVKTVVNKVMSKQMTNKIDGVVLLNKDKGITSNRALQQVKRALNAQKAGHTGSLDPLAAGVLPICLGEATKFSRFLLDADKSYVVTAQLGITTTTGDAEGEILSYMQVPIINNLQEIMNEFLGAGVQIPSMYSALKYNGQPLYRLARQNIQVERAAREIFISEFQLLKQTDDIITCYVSCSKGTYIRTLIEDLGALIGCGAHVTDLLRTQAGKFTIGNACTYQDILNNNFTILPLECLLEGLPRVIVTGNDMRFICTGRSIVTPSKMQGIVCLVGDDNRTLGIGEAFNDGSVVPKRLIASDV